MPMSQRVCSSNVCFLEANWWLSLDANSQAGTASATSQRRRACTVWTALLGARRGPPRSASQVRECHDSDMNRSYPCSF